MLSAAGVRLSRRRLLQGGGALFASALLLSFRSLVDRLGARSPRSHRLVIPPGTAREVFFADGVIVSRRQGTVRAFSSRCPHLGCEITRELDGLLVCPCHGSRFAIDGSVASGPALRSLEPLSCAVDPSTGAITVLL